MNPELLEQLSDWYFLYYASRKDADSERSRRVADGLAGVVVHDLEISPVIGPLIELTTFEILLRLFPRSWSFALSTQEQEPLGGDVLGQGTVYGQRRTFAIGIKSDWMPEPRIDDGKLTMQYQFRASLVGAGRLLALQKRGILLDPGEYVEFRSGDPDYFGNFVSELQIQSGWILDYLLRSSLDVHNPNIRVGLNFLKTAIRF